MKMKIKIESDNEFTNEWGVWLDVNGKCYNLIIYSGEGEIVFEAKAMDEIEKLSNDLIDQIKKAKSIGE